MKKIILFIFLLIVYKIQSQDWGEKILTQPIQGTSHYFGESVSIDGDYAVVGAPNENEATGAAHVFKKDANGNWNHIQKITAFVGKHLDEYFGSTVHIKGDFIFIAAPTDRLDEVLFESAAGSVMIYKNDGADNFVGIQRIRSSDIHVNDYFGGAIDSFGDYLIVGSPGDDEDANGLNTIAQTGAAYVFKKDAVNDVWNQIQKIVPSHRKAFDNSANSVAISENYIVLGSSNDTDVDGLNPVNGSGAAFVFKKDAVDDVWTETQKLKASDNGSTFGFFGIDVDGDYIAVGAKNASSVYMFKVNAASGVWSQTQKITATAFSTGGFGTNLALKNNILIASAPSSSIEKVGLNLASGSAFVFKNNNENWTQITQIIPSDGEENGAFGGGFRVRSAVDFDGTHFIIGSPYRDGENGANTFLDAGKAYISGNINGFLGQTITWTGALNTDWNNPQNWDTNSVPTLNDDVILADVVNAPTIKFNQNHTIKSLVNNEILNIKTTSSLTVLGDIDQRNAIIINSFVNTNGSLIVKGNQLNANPPNINYLRYISANNWHLIASPVTGFDIDVFAANYPLAIGQGNNRGFGFFNNNIPRWDYYQNGANGSGNFVVGKGYSVNLTANSFLQFTGKLNTNNLLNYAIQDNTTGWNLIGNPYPAFINANVNADVNLNFLTENAANLHPEFANIYVWNPTTSNYEPVGNGLGAKYIAPGQGFFVKSKVGGGIINIRKTMLSHQNGDLFLKQKPTQKIVFQITDNTNISETTIAFKQQMTKGLDITFDAAMFTGEKRNLSLYTYLLEDNKNTPFAIQFLPKLDQDNIIIPLGILQKGNKKITFSLKESNLSSDIKIFLEDKLLNTFTKISKTATSTFSQKDKNAKVGRFFLHFLHNSLNTNQIEKPSVYMYKDSSKTIHIKGVSKGLLNIYSTTGQQIIKNYTIDNKSKEIQLNTLSKGIYLFKIQTNNQEYIQKIFF